MHKSKKQQQNKQKNSPAWEEKVVFNKLALCVCGYMCPYGSILWSVECTKPQKQHSRLAQKTSGQL